MTFMSRERLESLLSKTLCLAARELDILLTRFDGKQSNIVKAIYDNFFMNDKIYNRRLLKNENENNASEIWLYSEKNQDPT